MNEPRDPGHPIGPEIDDSPNPTASSPDEGVAGSDPYGGAAAPDVTVPPDAGAEPAASVPPEWDQETGSEPRAGSASSESQSTAQGGAMVAQLQQMIDSVAEQAGPALRQVAAKAAELAAVAGERAGPLAHRAADVTERLGGRVAARSKEMAADLRRREQQEDENRETGG